MIEPYEAVLKSLRRDYATLGLKVEHNEDYRVSLSNDDLVLTIATEKNYQPSILASVEDCTGNRFELGLARRVLSENRYEADMEELAAIKSKYRLDSGNASSRENVSGSFIYVRVALEGIFVFLAEFGRQVNSENEAFLSEYKARERALLGRFGL